MIHTQKVDLTIQMPPRCIRKTTMNNADVTEFDADDEEEPNGGVMVCLSVGQGEGTDVIASDFLFCVYMEGVKTPANCEKVIV